MKKIVRAYIGLGSNLNNPPQQIRQAIAAIAQLPQTTLIATSSFYETPPLGPKDQPDFVNAAIAIDTQLEAHTLFEQLQAIEIQQGRVKTRHWGERTIDLDLLLYGNECIHTDNLKVPHPGLKKRNFVLIPLLEIAPDLILPDGESVQKLKNIINK
jgi:2-amino-4-hydroxy-6-hydroxymethyldihydropteridine diphosphokinase